jgi:ketosteroid isomerase-like protein
MAKFDDLDSVSSSEALETFKSWLAQRDRNVEVCKNFFRHVSVLEIDKALECVTDDVVWWVQGDWPGSGFHFGKDALKRLNAGISDTFVTGIDLEFGHATAEEDRVALELRSNAALRNGLIYNNTYHFLFTIRDGLIAIAKEYLDTKHLVETAFYRTEPAVDAG